MVKRLAIICLILLTIAVLSVPAGASLVPMSWGFPVMIQNSTLTGFQSSNAANSDLESANIAFPTRGKRYIQHAFPTIGQNSLHAGPCKIWHSSNRLRARYLHIRS